MPLSGMKGNARDTGEGRHKRGEHVGGMFAHRDVGWVVDRIHFTVETDTPS